MKNAILSLLWYIVAIAFVLDVNLCLAQDEEKEDKTKFSSNRYSARRYSTSEKDKKDKLLLPKYDEIAADKDKGITLEDWQKYCLSESSFKELDQNNDSLISREELDEDEFMGDVQRHEQTKELIRKYCKDEFPDYNEKIKLLKQKGYNDIEKTVYYFVNKKWDFGIKKKWNKEENKDEKIPLHMRSEYPGTEEVATKTYIQIKHGQLIQQKVDLGHYALLVMRDQKEEDVSMSYVFAFIFVVIVASVAAVVPIFK